MVKKKKKEPHVYIQRERVRVYTRVNKILLLKEYSLFRELFNFKNKDNANYIVIKGQSWWLAVLRTA